MDSPRTSPTLPAAILWIAATLALSAYVFRLPPGTSVPLHFGFNGTVDRYGSTGALAAFLLGVGVVGAFGWMSLDLMRQRTQRLHAYVAAQIALLMAWGVIDLIEAAQVMGRSVGLDATTPRFHMAALALLFAGIGAVLGKVPQNPLVGVRTYWTRSSRLAWEKSNRLGGRLMFWIGVVGLLIAPMSPQPLGIRMLIGSVLLSAAACVFESWRVWRSDPDRMKI